MTLNEALGQLHLSPPPHKRYSKSS